MNIYKDLEDIQQSFNNARGTFQIWNCFRSHPKKNNPSPEICADMFLVASLRAFALTFAIELHSIFDKNRQTISIPNILKSIEHSTQKDLFDLINYQYNNLNNRVSKLKILRDKLLAHKQSGYSMPEFIEENVLNIFEIKEIFDDLYQHLSLICQIQGVNISMRVNKDYRLVAEDILLKIFKPYNCL